jgi:hypothetical protein
MTTNTETIFSLAAELASYFETRTRNNGDTFLTLRDGHPDWMHTICRAAHESPTIGTIMPDDIRYEMINECLDAIAQCNDQDALDDRKYELSAPDYNSDLIQWFSSHNCRASFCDAYRDEMGASCRDIMGQIRDGYVYEIREVFDLLVAALTELSEVLSSLVSA